MRRTHSPEATLFEQTSQQSRLEQLGDHLSRLNSAIKWESFRTKLEKAYPVEIGKQGGRPRKDPVMMFKIVVLQRLYNLSDREMEYQLTDRTSFMRFAGCKSIADIPDEKTIWLFKERMKEAGLMDELFDGYTRGLRKANLIANQGVLVDATIVEAPIQRNSKEENDQIKEGKRPLTWKSKPGKDRQKDTDALWTHKHGKNYYGYKDHVKADEKSKLILDYQVTPANEHDSQCLSEIVGKEDMGQRIHADSAYVGPAIEEYLNTNGIENQIHERGRRNKPLTKRQESGNKRKSKVRARVEHIFGQMTMQLKGITLRTIGLARASLQIGIMNLVYNMVRSEYIMRKHGTGLPICFISA